MMATILLHTPIRVMTQECEKENRFLIFQIGSLFLLKYFIKQEGMEPLPYKFWFSIIKNVWNGIYTLKNKKAQENPMPFFVLSLFYRVPKNAENFLRKGESESKQRFELPEGVVLRTA